MRNFDLIIIGSGPGGYPAAAEALRQGLSVAVVERSEPGGTCLNRGCIPTKCLCHTADLALDAASSAACGVECGEVIIDYARAAARKDEVVEQLRQGVAGIISGAEFIKGEASFKAPLVVEVNGEELTAPRVILATGAEPARLPVPGADEVMTSDDVLRLTELPASMAVIGAGVIGLEFASLFAALGVKVTVVEYCPEVLPPIDSEVAKRLRMALRRRGISFNLGAKVTAVTAKSVTFEAKGKEQTIEADSVLMAVGRRAVVPAGLAELGIETIRGAVKVNPETMETNLPGLYAVGDVNGICQLAHAATAQAMRVMGVEQTLEPVPSAVFTRPELAQTGITEAAALKEGRNVRVRKATFRANGKAMAMDETDGMFKIVTDAETDAILGATILGPHSADIIQEITVAMAAGITFETLKTVIHPHPTLSEVILSAV